MKSKIFISVIMTFLFILLISCEKNDETDAVNINGSWLGTWNIDDEHMSGTFLTPVIQNGGNFEGEMFIMIDGPEINGYRPEYRGAISGNEPRVTATISGVEVIGKGTVENDSVYGRFTISNLGIEGGFSGIKYPMSRPEYSILWTLKHTDDFYRKIFCMGSEIWLKSFMSDDYFAINHNGTDLGTRSLKDEIYSDAFASDGNKLWVETYDTNTEKQMISIYSSNGQFVRSFENPFESLNGSMCISGDTVFMNIPGRKYINHYTIEGVLMDSTEIPFLSYSDIERYGQGFLLSTYAPYMFYVDKKGNLLEAYKTNLPVFNLSRSTDGNMFGLTNESIRIDNDWKDNYQIIRFDDLIN